MDRERLPMASLYADVRAYCSHVNKMYCKRVRLLSSRPQLFNSSLSSDWGLKSFFSFQKPADDLFFTRCPDAFSGSALG